MQLKIKKKNLIFHLIDHFIRWEINFSSMLKKSFWRKMYWIIQIIILNYSNQYQIAYLMIIRVSSSYIWYFSNIEISSINYKIIFLIIFLYGALNRMEQN